MNQLGQMKQQMGGSMTPQMEQQHQQQLQEMQQRFNTIKKQGNISTDSRSISQDPFKVIGVHMG